MKIQTDLRDQGWLNIDRAIDNPRDAIKRATYRRSEGVSCENQGSDFRGE